jgi:hypothetical protein
LQRGSVDNFTLCDLDNYDVIIGNTFLDAYKINIFCNKGKLIICAKNGYKLMNINAIYNFALAKMGMDLVALINELESFSFLIFM